MFLISHRGNISGKLPERENTVDYIQEALGLGYDVEVDVWMVLRGAGAHTLEFTDTNANLGNTCVIAKMRNG